MKYFLFFVTFIALTFAASATPIDDSEIKISCTCSLSTFSIVRHIVIGIFIYHIINYLNSRFSERVNVIICGLYGWYLIILGIVHSVHYVLGE